MDKKVSISQFLRTSMLSLTVTVAIAGLVPAHSEDANRNVVTELLAQLKAPPPERQPGQALPSQFLSQSYWEGSCGGYGCAICERPHVHQGGIVTCHTDRH